MLFCPITDEHQTFKGMACQCAVSVVFVVTLGFVYQSDVVSALGDLV